MIGKRMKHANRYREILTALLKNGFGFIINDLGLTDFITNFSRKKSAADDIMFSISIGERIRLCIEQLGPTFIKLGQLASFRLDLIPLPIIKELEKLQDHVTPFPFQEVKLLLEKELGEPIEKLFKNFRETPSASGSIGQVHYATLLNGSEVAVKIQRPNIEQIIETDLNILMELAQLMEKRMDWANTYNLSEIILELSKSLRKELDFLSEGYNCEKITRQMKQQPNVVIPSIYWDFTTKRVLVMEYIHGKKLPAFLEEAASDQRNKFTHIFIDSMFDQIFIYGFFHSDPHPGNIFILEDGKIAYIDFGMVGRLSTNLKFDLVSLIIALKNQDKDEIIDLVLKMGSIGPLFDKRAFYADMEDLLDRYMYLPIQKIFIGELMNDLMSVSFRHQIKMPADLTMLAKTLITMEGIVSKLNMEISIIEMAQPFGEKLMRERLKPASLLKEARARFRILRTSFMSIQTLAQNLTRNGKINIQLDLPEIKELIHKLDRISNQLSLSIVLLSFSILMVGLIIGSAIARQKTLLWDFPVIEIGSIVATLMFLWLLYGIFKSGKF